MKLEHRLPPHRLAALGLGASLIPFADACWAAWPTRSSIHVTQSHQSVLKFLFGFAFPFGLALWAAYSSAAALRRGIDEALWPPPTLELLRTRLNATALSVLAYGLTLFGVGVAVTNLLVSSPRNGAGGSFAYFLAFPLITLSNLRRALVPRTAPRTTIWADMKPVFSELWGQRRPQP